jgi:hypothetical protein
MLTRRAVLTGTAAASIATIASSRGVAVADDNGFGAGFGDLDGGALGAFQKTSNGFGIYMKWEGSGAEIFYKENSPGTVEVFSKAFLKGWTPVASQFLKTSLDGTEGVFQKVRPDGAEFFVKDADGITRLFSKILVLESEVVITSAVPDSD